MEDVEKLLGTRIDRKALLDPSLDPFATVLNVGEIPYQDQYEGFFGLAMIRRAEEEIQLQDRQLTALNLWYKKEADEFFKLSNMVEEASFVRVRRRQISREYAELADQCESLLQIQ